MYKVANVEHPGHVGETCSTVADAELAASKMSKNRTIGIWFHDELVALVRDNSIFFKVWSVVTECRKKEPMGLGDVHLYGNSMEEMG